MACHGLCTVEVVWCDIGCLYMLCFNPLLRKPDVDNETDPAARLSSRKGIRRAPTLRKVSGKICCKTPTYFCSKFCHQFTIIKIDDKAMTMGAPLLCGYKGMFRIYQIRFIGYIFKCRTVQPTASRYHSSILYIVQYPFIESIAPLAQ